MMRFPGRGTSLRACLVAACLVALCLGSLPAFAAEPEERLSAADAREERAREQAEAEREAEERKAEEEERLREQRERDEERRHEELGEALRQARRDLRASESGLSGALGTFNLAIGDQLVARYDLDDATARLADAERLERRAVDQLAAATSRLDDAQAALVADAVAAYQAGSTSQTPEMVAVEALIRSRSPKEFVNGLDYLDGLLSSRAEAESDAEVAVRRWEAQRDDAQEERIVAERDRVAAEAALAAAEAAIPGARRQLESAFTAHARLTTGLVSTGEKHTRPPAKPDQLSSRAEELVRRTADLGRELMKLSERSADVGKRTRSGYERIASGSEGVPAWRDFACPIDGPVQFVNDWGFPRTGGRSHEGTDVFADRGTAIVAMADGVVTRISRQDVGLGGLTVTYEIDGHRVYNAHLEEVASGLDVGDELEAGQPIGTVGTSGNAVGTPPHNHMGLYLPGGAPVNPYPLLRRACD